MLVILNAFTFPLKVTNWERILAISGECSLTCPRPLLCAFWSIIVLEKLTKNRRVLSRFFPGYLRNVESQVALRSFKNLYDICVYYLVNENKGKAAYMPNDSQTRSFLTMANAYALSNIRWILNKIELTGNPIGIDLSSLSIGHIMPQTINEY